MQHHDPVYTIPEFPSFPEIPSITSTPSVTVDIPDAPPVEPSLAELFLTMSNAMKQMAVKIHNLEVLLQAQAPTDIEEKIADSLLNFEDRVIELIADNVDEHIDNHMRNNFDIDDHVDVEEIVKDTLNNNLTISFDI
jgi:hypothetical protein